MQLFNLVFTTNSPTAVATLRQSSAEFTRHGHGNGVIDSTRRSSVVESSPSR
jgi:hypothetical protein